jgi:hypothetical protein
VEFFTEVSRVLNAEGTMLCNLVDEPGLAYLGRAIAGLWEIFGNIVLVASQDVLKGRRFGNVVLAATSEPFNIDELRRQISRQPFPAGVWDNSRLRIRFGTERPFTDADKAESPEPSREGWRVR